MIVVSGPGQRLDLLRFVGSLEQTSAHFDRNDVIGFAMQDEDRRVHVADMADRVVAILEQQPDGQPRIELRGTLDDRRERAVEDHASDLLLGAT